MAPTSRSSRSTPVNEPNSDIYDVTVIAAVTGDDVVDIAFDAIGALFAFEVDGQEKSVNKTTGAETLIGAPGRAGASGLRMAFHATDAGSLLGLTEKDAGKYDVDAFDPVQTVTRMIENDVDWDDGALAFTVSQWGSAGAILEIDDDLDVGNGGYPIWDRGRRSWSGILSGGVAIDDRLEWDAGPHPTLVPCTTQCFADLTDPNLTQRPPDAFTVPHFVLP
jgi:hypothetical protein